MAVDAVSSSSSATYDSSTDRVVKKSLGQEDFYKLLATQLANQDPLSPMENTEYIAQMASFSSLEAINTLASSFSSFSAQQGFMTVQSVLGKNVTVQGDDGEITGLATAIFTEDGQTMVTIDGEDYSANSILRVEVRE